MFCIAITLLLVLVVDGHQHYFSRRDPLARWVGEQSRFARERILANIAPFAGDPTAMAGAMCASPSRSRPDYYYVWTRDSALVMSEILSWLDDGHVDGRLDIALDSYVGFTRHVQSLDSAVYGLGEAKFHMNGTVFTGSWCNAQTDGPAIRALAMMRLGLWKTVRSDLDYVERVWWRNGGCDIWEESRGLHFYTLMAQHRALREGAQVAQRRGDPVAERYLEAATGIEKLLERFNHGVVVPTIEWSGGLDGKSDLDTQVLLAALHFTEVGETYSVESPVIISTVLAFLRRFEPMYDINRVAFTDIYGVRVPVGVAVGRYPEDVYNGVGSSRGNPWSLITSALAEYHYRLALAYADSEELVIGPELAALLRWSAPYLNNGDEVLDSLVSLQSYLLAVGDLYMARVARHTGRDHTMYEQWNRRTGFGQGAIHLTWSYAAHTAAARAREKLVEAINN
ncbi:Glucoamylase, intracellular sporulation-specific [Coemansia sp. IMI 209128]|nr:hypothetical protein GGI10_000674 [Coemansia sp. RSA 2530]KAJ2693903.1 Glucoamylase, intracellular sporulation-specific [Coemansia sp. IMI 209128]